MQVYSLFACEKMCKKLRLTATQRANTTEESSRGMSKEYASGYLWQERGLRATWE